MKVTVFSSLFLFLVLSLLSPCTGADVTTATVETAPHTPSGNSNSTELQIETFSLLKEKFQGNILDKHFETLRKLVSDEIYLDFLRRSHPIDKPFKTFEEFFQTALPPAERYLRFWHKHVEKTAGEIDSEELAILHKLAFVNWHMIIRGFHGEKPDFESLVQLFVVDGNEEDLIALFRKNGKPTLGHLANVFIQLAFFAAETQEIDAKIVKTFIDTHGRAHGLVWLSLKEPILLGQILLSFTDTDIFLRWIDGEFDGKKKRSKD